MLVERTEIVVGNGKAEAFGRAMADRGLPLLRAVPGVTAISFGRGVEDGSKFMLLVTWRAMADHHAYNETAPCAALRALIGPFAASAAMEHFELD